MSEPQPSLRLTSPSPAADTGAHPAEPVEPAIVQGELGKVIAELQQRLATLESQKSAARGRRRAAAKASTDDASLAAHAPPQADALDARFRDLREQEAVVLTERLGLHTRQRAAQQEEVLLRNETHTLQLKLRAFKAMSLRLREQESELARAAAELKSRQETFERERQVAEQGRQELERIKAQLERERETLEAQLQQAREQMAAEFQCEREAMSAAAAATSVVVAPRPTGGPRPAELAAASITGPTLAATNATSLVLVRPAGPLGRLRTSLGRVPLAFGLALIGLAGAALVSIALGWLTVTPIYRATAIITPAATTAAESSAVADHFTTPVIAESLGLLAQRGMRPFETPDAMAASLQKNMTLALGPNRALALSYESPDRDMAVFVLDALSRAYAKVHAGAGTKVSHAAAADLFPYRDGRAMRAAMWFICFVLIAAAITAARMVLQMRQARTRATLAKPSPLAAV